MTDKQARFCEEYMIDLNATQAAIRAGYSPKTANEQAARLLANVSIQNRIAQLQAEQSRRTGVSADRVVRELAKVAANMVDAVLTGKQPEINDTKTYNNGVKVVPSYLLKPVAVDASNWNGVLIGSGYYTEAQVK